MPLNSIKKVIQTILFFFAACPTFANDVPGGPVSGGGSSSSGGAGSVSQITLVCAPGDVANTCFAANGITTTNFINIYLTCTTTTAMINLYNGTGNGSFRGTFATSHNLSGTGTTTLDQACGQAVPAGTYVSATANIIA